MALERLQCEVNTYLTRKQARWRILRELHFRVKKQGKHDAATQVQGKKQEQDSSIIWYLYRYDYFSCLDELDDLLQKIVITYVLVRLSPEPLKRYRSWRRATERTKDQSVPEICNADLDKICGACLVKSPEEQVFLGTRH